MHSDLINRLRKLRFLQLILYILVSALILPFFRYDWLMELVSNIFLLNALLVSLSTGPNPWRWQGGLWVLFGISVLLTGFSLLSTDPGVKWWLLRLGLKVDVVFLLLCLAAILHFIFTHTEVDADQIFAAVVAYLILGLAFAQSYGLIFAYDQTSFNLAPPGDIVSLALLHGSFIYYSFMVITTVGMGDILPMTPLARSLTIIEAVSGQFFVAVLVAWLVGRFIAANHDR